MLYTEYTELPPMGMTPLAHKQHQQLYWGKDGDVQDTPKAYQQIAFLPHPGLSKIQRETLRNKAGFLP